MPDLDILIPHFEDAEGLLRSLQSIRQQTWTGGVRAVILDDSSTLSSYRQVERIAKESELAIKLCRNEENRGRPYTRNRLLDQIEAPYVAWLDAGDTWYPDKLEFQFARVEELRQEGVDTQSAWISCDYDWRWAGKVATPTTQSLEGDQLQEILIGARLRSYLWTLLQPSASLLRVGAFDEELPRLQDLDYFIRFAAAGGVIYKPSLSEPSPLCVYEKTDVGRDGREIRRCNHRIFEKHEALFARYGKGFVEECLVKAELHSARFAKNNGDIPLFCYFTGKAVLRSPFRAMRYVARKTFEK